MMQALEAAPLNVNRRLPANAIEVQLVARTCLRRPDFALRDLAWDGEVFEATAATARPLGAACGPMSSGELLRHASAAGICAAALLEGRVVRWQYVAEQARSILYPTSSREGTPVRFRARATPVYDRSVFTLVEAYTDDAWQDAVMLSEIAFAVRPAARA
jgi:hypothetical protein